MERNLRLKTDSRLLTGGADTGLWEIGANSNISYMFFYYLISYQPTYEVVV